MVATAIKFRSKAWLNRVGVLDQVERWRLKRRFKKRVPHEADFFAFKHLSLKPGLFVDVGANMGQSVLSFRCLHPTIPILSFEPNHLMEPFLTYVKTFVSNFDFHICGLGAMARDLNYCTPVIAGYEMAQEATFDPGVLQTEVTKNRFYHDTSIREFSIKERVLSIRALDEFDVKACAIKIDVQGFEIEVLRGAEMTVQRCQPILMVEHGDRVQPVMDWTLARGYKPFTYNQALDCLMPMSASDNPLNIFFLPPSSK